jgi:hypothetical protein
MVCNECLAANHDGITPETYPQLATHLKIRGIQPENNADGWILWPAN